jgi:misacylated tRNA(Ala) deacylase
MNPLYFNDSYLKEFTSKVVSIKDDKYVILENTAFYPTSGGQPYDTGVLVKGKEEYPVIFVGKFEGNISHEVTKQGLKVGDTVTGKINWNRRYKLMRSHTSAHIVSAILHNTMGALITGNQLEEDKVRIDFNITDYDPELLKNVIDEANTIVKKDIPLKIYYVSRETVENDPRFTKLAKGLPQGIPELRVVEIIGFDTQADGGTHVKSTAEVGKLEFLKSENKGKDNRRVYYRLL